ncbi:MAG: TAXI family TRAP transporter solute-binding subunit [Pirellulaceae bacterium]|jgi:TRAP-type uncharacterized transport system substrate-binding protein|nr:TAXI family TRAP transporter solute-binding subunit [Pirellulaceae bacterium]
MRNRYIVLTLVVCLAPLAIRWAYIRYTELPKNVVLATGPESGEWTQLSNNLADAIERIGEAHRRIDVTRENQTSGAIDHLKRIDEKQVDFALYMRGARGRHSADVKLNSPPQFVANVYSDLVLFVVRRDLYESGELRTPADLQKTRTDGTPYRVAVGHPDTGERGVADAVLDYYLNEGRGGGQATAPAQAGGAKPEEYVERVASTYQESKSRFEKKTLDAALITAGHQAPILAQLLGAKESACRLGAIPEADAIVTHRVSLKRTTIPQGLFRAAGANVPEQPVTSLSSKTMLLTHDGVSSQMVEEVVKIILSEDFIQQNKLYELSQQGVEFASANPEFPTHPGAQNAFDPKLKPLVDPDFMEATENLRSFGVSLLIAGFLAYQWYRRSVERRKDHLLDEYFDELLKIDRRTLEISADDEQGAKRLRETLERVIGLRNEALSEFSAKDFDEDSAADSFLHLCETVAAGIRSQLLRWQLRRSIEELSDQIKSSNS